jgi:urease accessory protein
MGEVINTLIMTDRRDITRDGRLIHREAVDAGRALGDWHGPALLGGARVMASLVATGPDLALALPGLRALAVPGVELAASAYDGRLVLRALACELWPLKRLLARAITHVTKAPLPRVWQI